MKNFCLKMSGVIALLICLPVMYRIYKGDIFNPASFFLWSALSVVCTVVLIRAGEGGYTMVIGYILSDLAIAIYAYVKGGKMSFGKFEWLVITMTAICAVLYAWCRLRKNFKPAVIANSSACMIAGIPQVVDSFRHPYQLDLKVCSLYLLVSVLAYYGEKPNMTARLLPGLSIIYWILIAGGVVILRLR